MKKLLISSLFVAGMALGQIGVGIRIGPPPPPKVLRVIPRSPGPGYVWIGGYWYVVEGRWRWHAGLLDIAAVRGRGVGGAAA